MTAGLIVGALGVGGGSSAVTLGDLFASGDAGLIVTAMGILTLALTPALRVVALVFIWWRERDWRFVGIALTVTIILALAMILGKGG